MDRTKELRSIFCTIPFPHREEPEYRILRFHEPSFEGQVEGNSKDCGPKCESGTEPIPRNSSDRRAASSKVNESQHSRAATAWQSAEAILDLRGKRKSKRRDSSFSIDVAFEIVKNWRMSWRAIPFVSELETTSGLFDFRSSKFALLLGKTSKINES